MKKTPDLKSDDDLLVGLKLRVLLLQLLPQIHYFVLQSIFSHLPSTHARHRHAKNKTDIKIHTTAHRPIPQCSILLDFHIKINNTLCSNAKCNWLIQLPTWQKWLLTEDFFVASSSNSCCCLCCSSSIRWRRSSIFCFSSLNFSISSYQNKTHYH